MGCKIVTLPWPRPFQGRFVTDRLGHAMINPPTKSQVPNFTRLGPFLRWAYCIARYWSKIADMNLRYLYLAPRWGWYRWNIAEIFDISKLDFIFWAIVWRCLCDPLYNFDLWRTDGLTDGRTHDDSIYRASIARALKMSYSFSLATVVTQATVM